MSAPYPENPLWEEHLERWRRVANQRPTSTKRASARRVFMSDRDAGEARRAEWTASPPGRLGRRLLADVEPYLAFFAIVRAD
jgi:hypothetical protein